jgi:hypothetical protein
VGAFSDFVVSSRARALGQVLLWLAYASIVGLALELVVWRARAGHIRAWVSEDGGVECLHAALAVVAGCVLLARLARGWRGSELRAVLGLACLYAAARELDGFFGASLGPHAYKIFAAPLAAAAAVVAWRARAVLPAQIADFLATPAAALVFAGSVVVLVHAQVLGQKELWQLLVPSADYRIVKRTVEECSELTGYLLIVFAAVEIELRSRKLHPFRPD